MSGRTIYGIYRECLQELSRRGIIEGMSFDVIQESPGDPFTALQYVERPAESLALPAFDEMLLHYQIFVDAIPKQMADAAAESVVSGRRVTDIRFANAFRRVSAVGSFGALLHCPW